MKAAKVTSILGLAIFTSFAFGLINSKAVIAKINLPQLLPSGHLSLLANPMLPMGSAAGSIDHDKTGPRVVLPPGVPEGSTNYRMYYEAVPGPNQSYVGYATSPDGITWTKQGKIDSLDPSLPWETGYYIGETSPNSILIENGVWKLWYHGYGLKGTSYVRRIGYATSFDGINWTKNPNFVLDVGNPGSYDDQFVAEPRVIKLSDGSYRMYYGAKRTADTQLSGYTWTYATSPDGINWTKTNIRLMEGTSALTTSGELHGCGHGLVYDGSMYHVWYETGDWNFINYASSIDGLTWTKGPSNPVFSAVDDIPGTNAYKGVGDSVSAYYDQNGSFRVMFTSGWYNSSSDRAQQIALAFAYPVAPTPTPTPTPTRTPTPTPTPALPVISSFSVAPTPNAPVNTYTIKETVSGATTLTLSFGGFGLTLPAAGSSQQITISANTSFVLKATNAAGTTTKTVNVVFK
jgi:hypothetical protein